MDKRQKTGEKNRLVKGREKFLWYTKAHWLTLEFFWLTRNTGRRDRGLLTATWFGSTGRSLRAAGAFPLAAAALENGHYDKCEAIL